MYCGALHHIVFASLWFISHVSSVSYYLNLECGIQLPGDHCIPSITSSVIWFHKYFIGIWKVTFYLLCNMEVYCLGWCKSLIAVLYYCKIHIFLKGIIFNIDNVNMLTNAQLWDELIWMAKYFWRMLVWIHSPNYWAEVFIN